MKKKIVLAAFMALTLAILQGHAVAHQSCNPLATPDQLFAEYLATYIVAEPSVQAAAQTLYNDWLANPGTATVSAEQMAYFQDAVNEHVFGAALNVQATDPNYPKLISILAAPHTWFDMSVPGSRTVFDNPDTIYIPVTIDWTASYVIHGKHNKQPPVDENFSLWDAHSSTLANLSGKDLVTERDGSFTITVDSNPANGRVNHIQTTSAAKSLFIRNTMNDWATQTYDSLSIERVAGSSLPAPQTFDDLVAQTVAGLQSPMGAINVFNARVNAQPVNTIPPITKGGNAGTLATQAQEYSAWQLSEADDDALVVTVNLGGAKYFICPVYTQWQITTDYVHHTQSLNNAQAKRNHDGTYTFVISVKDPGVYNWIDTVGMHTGDLNLRWQGLPSTPPKFGDVSATMQLVKLADLKTVLPKGTVYVNAKQRERQLEERAADFARRYATLPECPCE
jgi:hypothetical protein